MSPFFTIGLARSDETAVLPAIEREAASLFAGWPVPIEVLEEETTLSEFSAAQRAGRLWVARINGGRVVGFALVELVGGRPHLEEIDVHPSQGRRGIGRALVEAVREWARVSGHTSLTLTTFREIPWNAPFYGRIGFRELSPHELTPELQAVIREEASRGLDPAARLVMVSSLGSD